MEKVFSPSQVRTLSKAVRIQNLVIIVLMQYFTAFFLTSRGFSWQSLLLDKNLFLLSLSTVLIAAAGYIINDYYDIKIDYVNRPREVLIGKKISRRMAMFLHTGFNLIGVAIGTYLSITIGMINLLAAISLWWYSNNLKRLPFIGNFVVGSLSGLAVFVIGVLYPGNWIMVIMYAFFAGFFSLIREVIKDLEDISGDEKFGSKTLPIVWGTRKTKIFLYALITVFNVSFSWLAYDRLGSNWEILSGTMLILSAILVVLIRFADTRKDYSKLSMYCKVILFLGILSMAFIN